MKTKSTTWVLLAVLVIFASSMLAGGGRLYRWLTAPRIAPDVAPQPTVEVTTATRAPTATPLSPGWQAQQDPHTGMPYLSPPDAEIQAMREAFAVLLQRSRVADTAEATLLAYDRESSITQARAYVAQDYAWPLLDTRFVFVYTALGPENGIRCDDTARCRLSQAVLGIRAVLIFEEAMCQSAGHVPCLAPLDDTQIDARDTLVTATFRKARDGVWQLTGWDVTPLPALPENW